MECRANCGACCEAPSISSPIPGMPKGKPAGIRCIQLDEDNKCKLFNQPTRPEVCLSLKPVQDMCLGSREDALAYLKQLEEITKP